MQTKYSKEFKIEVVKKVLSRSPETSISSIARGLGIAATTLQGWIKAMANKELVEFTSASRGEKTPFNWSIQERFDAIVESAQLSDKECMEYCRNKGIFPHHLETWKREFLEGVKKKNRSLHDDDIKALKLKNKTLTAELQRKEKALAEAAALLVLKKKIDLHWGTNEEG